jgi:NADPH-dependent curcumin reductase CurA
VIVSTAAGSVGSTVGQLAKAAGCKTVGITGGPAKVELCKTLFAYDHVIDYKSERSLGDAVSAACHRGANIYFDNTSGEISDAVIPHLSIGGRVVICGTAAVPSWDPLPLRPRFDRLVLMNRLRIEGFIIFDYQHRYEEAVTLLADMVRSGKLQYREDILDGIEACPDSIAGLYRGENLGKRLIRLH